MKRCARCGAEKPATREFFHVKNGTKDGFCLYCKGCIATKSKRDYENDRDRKLAYNKEYYITNQSVLVQQKRQYRKDNKEKVAANEKKCRENNREAVRQRKKQYYFTHKDHVLRYLEEYRKTHKERLNANNRLYQKINRDRLRGLDRIKRKKYIALGKGLAANYSMQQWNQCLEYFDRACCYCGNDQAKLEQEHFIPESKGGSYEPFNIVPSCGICNRKKRNHNFFDWYQVQPFCSNERMQKILIYLERMKHEERGLIS